MPEPSSVCRSGFRARTFGAPRNDAGVTFLTPFGFPCSAAPCGFRPAPYFDSYRIIETRQLRNQQEKIMSSLKGKVAVVTGASKGTRAGHAQSLSAAGASVVVNYASSKDGADRVVADITAKGGKAIAV